MLRDESLNFVIRGWQWGVQLGITGLFGRFDGFALGSQGRVERCDAAMDRLFAQRQMDTLLCSQTLLRKDRFDF